MTKKIKTSLLNIIIGLIAWILIDSFSRYLFFDYITCTIITAIIFLLMGILRGGSQVTSLLLKVLFINISTIISIKIAPLPATLFLPIPIVAIIFTFIGLYVRSEWTSETKIKYAVFAIGSLGLVSILSFLFYPQHISNFYTHQFNKSADDFEFISFEGDTIKSMDIKGDVILLDFWDSSCGTCIAAMPSLEILYQKYKSHPNIIIFCVDVGWKPLEKEKEFVQKKGYNTPFLYDEKSRNEELLGFGGSGFLIVIDKKFNIRLQHIGYNRSEDFVGSISRHIEQYLSEP
ncbi:MAG: TlpA disulfide reductase family protein [Bacteroidota bacterium]